MPDLTGYALVDRIEAGRRERRMTQSQVARLCGMTQPHYSKVLRGLVPPGARAEASMRNLLEEWAGGSPSREWQIAALAEAIGAASSSLMALVRVDRSSAARERGT